tara:strand:- start:62 stop:481 length:420 start_codon:yes stop_codon:yes gene_type:complete
MLTPWQKWAKKATQVTDEPFLYLLFHDENIDYIRAKTQELVKKETGMPCPDINKEQLVITLLAAYENLQQEPREDLRKLLIQANKEITASLVKKMMTNLKMYGEFYHNKVTQPQPLPLTLPINANNGGTRALEGGKPFV